MNGSAIYRRIVLFSCVISLFYTQLLGWWDQDWSRRITLTLDNGFVSSSVDSFPACVFLDPSRIDYSQCQANGADLRFIDADDATELAYEIDEWDASGTSVIWVRIPRVSTGGTADSIFLYYDNPVVAEGQDPAGVWDGGFIGVWHMDGDMSDRSGHGLDAVNYGATPIAGMAGGALNFQYSAADSDSVIVPDDPWLDSLKGAMTISAWVNKQTALFASWANIVNRRDSANDEVLSLRYYRHADDSVYVGVDAPSGDRAAALGNPTTGLVGVWMHYAGVYDGSNVLVYENGVATDSKPQTGDMPSSDGPLTMGCALSNDGTSVIEFFNGYIDEVWLSRVARSADWVEAQDSSIRDNLFNWGTPEINGVFKARYYSDGSPGASGDSMLIVFIAPVNDASVDMGAGNADVDFGETGLGSFAGATISTGATADDETLVVTFTASDTMFCKGRTRLFLRAGAVDSLGGGAFPADTRWVETYNVGVPGTGQTFRSLNEAYDQTVANDSILVFDAGEYPETLAVTHNLNLVGYGIDFPGNDSLPVILDPVLAGSGTHYLVDLVTGNMSCNLTSLKLVSLTAYMRAINVPDYSGSFNHTYRKCVFDGSGVARECFLDDFARGKITLDSCEFTGYTNLCIYWRHDDYGGNTGKYFTNCYFHDFNGPAIFFRDSRELLVENCRFENINNSYGIIYIPACNTMSITQNVFASCTGPGNGVIVMNWGCNNYSLDNNVFSECTNPAGAITLSQVYNGRIFNNLIYGGARGINVSGGTNTYRNMFAFNTIANCNDGGIIYNGNSTGRDTIVYNISWRNGPSDLQLSGGNPVADFNFYDPGRNLDWPVGAHTDSGYPAFVDTAADNYRLSPSSPCIDFTDVDTAKAATMGMGTDLDGNGRSAPAGTYADAGCYEEQVTGVLRVRNVDYWACGTENTNDDTMKVLFQHNLDDGTVPTGAGNADAVFGNVGLGSMAGATIYLSGIVDTNFLFIRLAAGDTVFSHLRSGLRIDGTSAIRSELGYAAQTDTARVNTYNVYNINDGTAFATLHGANYDAGAGDGDTIQVFDAGYYTDTLRVTDALTFRNTGSMRPVIRYNGSDTLNVGSIVSCGIFGDVPSVNWHGFEFDGVNTARMDTARGLLRLAGGQVTDCVFHGTKRNNSFLLYAETVSGVGDGVQIDSCVFYNTVTAILNRIGRSGQRISRNTIYGIYNGTGVPSGIQLYYGDSLLVENNVIYNAARGIMLRDADYNTVRGNLIYDCGYAGIYYFDGNCTHNTFRFNTVVRNQRGFAIGSSLAGGDTVSCNISWGNSVFDLDTTQGYRPVADYNMYASGKAADWLPGAHSTTDNPVFADYTGNDFHQRLHSPAIDRGDPSFTDYDGSCADMGAYGGPWAIDTLYPHRTDTLIVVPDQASGYATDSLYWGGYSLGNFALFAVYRDTFAGFIPSQANCVDSVWTAAATGVSVPGNGKDNVYKVSVANDTMYGGGYQTGTCAKVYFLKTSNRTLTVPGDTITYTLYYDNDGNEVSGQVFSIIDYLPARAEYLDTAAVVLHTGGTVDVDWYDGSWQETEPADPATIRAVRWEIQPGIGAQDGSGDASGEDQTGTGMDMNGGDDAGRVSFKVIVR